MDDPFGREMVAYNVETKFEFRINEKYAPRLFGEAEGKKLGLVRKITLSDRDPRLLEIKKLIDSVPRESGPIVFSWSVKRKYNSDELNRAPANRVIITTTFEPTGEECGTTYDYSDACSHCGAGRTQTSELILDLRTVPEGKDIARTIGDEWIISQRFAELLLDSDATGYKLQPIRHRHHGPGGDISFRNIHTGRELVSDFERQNPGLSSDDPQFAIWLNRKGTGDRYEQALTEMSVYKGKLSAYFDKKLPKWYQLVVTSPGIPLSPITRFGIDLFDADDAGQYRCPRCHVAGLNILSEPFVRRHCLKYDMMRSVELVGVRRGLLVLSPLLMFSTELSKAARTLGLKGMAYEAVRLDEYG
jgi:hypothetical protein